MTRNAIAPDKSEILLPKLPDQNVLASPLDEPPHHGFSRIALSARRRVIAGPNDADDAREKDIVMSEQERKPGYWLAGVWSQHLPIDQNCHAPACFDKTGQIDQETETFAATGSNPAAVIRLISNRQRNSPWQ